jgi:hypothetical protein
MIEPGEQYYDGGYWRRAHELCAQKAELDPSMEKSRAQQRAGYAATSERAAKRVMENPATKVPTIEEDLC